MATRVIQRNNLKEILAGFDIGEEEQSSLDDRLKRKEWKFRSSAHSLRLQLSSEDDQPLPGGRVRRGENLAAQFKEHRFQTNDKKVACLIYLSDAFHTRRVYDVEEDAERRDEMAFEDLKNLVLSDPTKLDRLREELFAAIEE